MRFFNVTSLKDKHLKKNITRYISALVAAAMLLPQTANAFEFGLAAPVSVLTLSAQIAPIDHEDTVAPQDEAGYLSHSVIAAASPITQSGQKLRNQTRVTSIDPNVALESGGVVLEGEASFYSRAGCLGCDPAVIMANGQPLDDNALTMAIGANRKHLVGHTATVTNLVTGASVNVTITDTGGFYQAKYGYRVADLTIATKNAIGMKGGVGQVRVEVH